MAEVLEQIVSISRRSKPAGSAAEAAFHEGHNGRSRRQSASATWAPTLDPQGLACLTAVIEAQLLPTLLRSYRPVQGMPLTGSGSA